MCSERDIHQTGYESLHNHKCSNHKFQPLSFRKSDEKSHQGFIYQNSFVFDSEREEEHYSGIL